MKTNSKWNVWMLLYAVGVFAFTLTAQAASFDCAKAGTKVEHIICDTPEISRLDDQLAAKYDEALKDKTRAKTIMRTQRAWLKERNQCANVDCVRNVYQIRIHELTSAQAQVLSKTMPVPPAHAGHYKLTKGGGVEVCEAYRRNLEFRHDVEPMACERHYDPKIKGFSSVKWRKLNLKRYFDLYVKTRIYLNSLPKSQGTSLSDKDMRKFIKQLRAESPENLRTELYLAQLDMGGNGKLVNVLAVQSYGCGPDRKISKINASTTNLYVVNKMLTDIDYPRQNSWGGWGNNATIELYKGIPYVEHYEPDDNWGHLLTGSGRLYILQEEPLRQTKKEFSDEEVSEHLASVCEFQYVPHAEKTK